MSKSDFGQYQCKAENVAGVRESPSVTLGVHGEVFISSEIFMFTGKVETDVELN